MPQEVMLRPAQVCERLGISKATLWRWIRSGDFPGGRRLSARIRVWTESEIQEWLEKCPRD